MSREKTLPIGMARKGKTDPPPGRSPGKFAWFKHKKSKRAVEQKSSETQQEEKSEPPRCLHNIPEICHHCRKMYTKEITECYTNERSSGAHGGHCVESHTGRIGDGSGVDGTETGDAAASGNGKTEAKGNMRFTNGSNTQIGDIHGSEFSGEDGNTERSDISANYSGSFRMVRKNIRNDKTRNYNNLGNGKDDKGDDIGSGGGAYDNRSEYSGGDNGVSDESGWGRTGDVCTRGVHNQRRSKNRSVESNFGYRGSIGERDHKNVVKTENTNLVDDKGQFLEHVLVKIQDVMGQLESKVDQTHQAIVNVQEGLTQQGPQAHGLEREMKQRLRQVNPCLQHARQETQKRQPGVPEYSQPAPLSYRKSASIAGRRIFVSPQDNSDRHTFASMHPVFNQLYVTKPNSSIHPFLQHTSPTWATFNRNPKSSQYFLRQEPSMWATNSMRQNSFTQPFLQQSSFMRTHNNKPQYTTQPFSSPASTMWTTNDTKQNSSSHSFFKQPLPVWVRNDVMPKSSRYRRWKETPSRMMIHDTIFAAPPPQIKFRSTQKPVTSATRRGLAIRDPFNVTGRTSAREGRSGSRPLASRGPASSSTSSMHNPYPTAPSRMRPKASQKRTPYKSRAARGGNTWRMLNSSPRNRFRWFHTRTCESQTQTDFTPKPQYNELSNQIIRVSAFDSTDLPKRFSSVKNPPIHGTYSYNESSSDSASLSLKSFNCLPGSTTESSSVSTELQCQSYLYTSSSSIISSRPVLPSNSLVVRTNSSTQTRSHRPLRGFGAEKQTEQLGKALLNAAVEGKASCVVKLLKNGAPVNFTHGSQWTPLHRATWGAHACVVAILLNHGADVHARTAYGLTALHIAAYSDPSGACLAALIDAGADANSPSHLGWTPLHYAAESGNSKGVRVLVEAGACVSTRSYKGKAPRESLKKICIRQLLTSD